MAQADLKRTAERVAALFRQHTMVPASFPEVQDFLRAVEAAGRASTTDAAPAATTAPVAPTASTERDEQTGRSR